MNKYIVVDMDLKKIVTKFVVVDDDAAIIHTFSLFNTPPANYYLYQVEVDIDKNWNFLENAKLIDLPDKITDEGEYFLMVLVDELLKKPLVYPIVYHNF